MREFKFRAWDKKEKIIFSHVYEQCTEEGYIPSVEGFWAFAETGDMEVMQYTGFKDKNGKEIYEGDIVTVFAWGTAIRTEIVIWSDKWGAWYRRGKNTIYSPVPLISATSQNSPDDEYEVIGNIYENPELLKKETE